MAQWEWPFLSGDAAAAASSSWAFSDALLQEQGGALLRARLVPWFLADLPDAAATSRDCRDKQRRDTLRVAAAVTIQKFVRVAIAIKAAAATAAVAAKAAADISAVAAARAQTQTHAVGGGGGGRGRGRRARARRKRGPTVGALLQQNLAEAAAEAEEVEA